MVNLATAPGLVLEVAVTLMVPDAEALSTGFCTLTNPLASESDVTLLSWMALNGVAAQVTPWPTNGLELVSTTSATSACNAEPAMPDWLLPLTTLTPPTVGADTLRFNAPLRKLESGGFPAVCGTGPPVTILYVPKPGFGPNCTLQVATPAALVSAV